MNAAPRRRLPTITTPMPAATTVPTVRNEGRSDRARVNRKAPTTTLTIASSASVFGEPIRGITKNGSTKVATIAPVVLTASREPEADPSVPVSSPEQRGRRREREAHHDRRRQDDDRRRPGEVAQRLGELRRQPVDERVRRRREDDGADRHEGGGQHLRDGDQADDRADAWPDQAEQDRASRDADQEQDQDDREHVGRAAGPGAEEPVPDHLVAERGQARHERQAQREATAIARRVTSGKRRRRRSRNEHGGNGCGRRWGQFWPG